MNVLITSGGTQEPIDGVRAISNFSTGKTGKVIAEYLKSVGHNIYFVHSLQNELPTGLTNKYPYKTSNELEDTVNSILASEHIDVVIQAAAVSDYVVDEIIIEGKSIDLQDVGKITTQKEMSLKLKARPKIISKFKEISKNKNLKVIGFKLTNTNSEDDKLNQIFKLSHDPKVDFVVHNDLSDISDTGHISTLYDKGNVISQSQTKEQLAENINNLLKEL